MGVASIARKLSIQDVDLKTRRRILWSSIVLFCLLSALVNPIRPYLWGVNQSIDPNRLGAVLREGMTVEEIEDVLGLSPGSIEVTTRGRHGWRYGELSAVGLISYVKAQHVIELSFNQSGQLGGCYVRWIKGKNGDPWRVRSEKIELLPSTSGPIMYIV
ncbi:MAG: hypothetical protein IH944_05285 [Armatimonadetes bacterium]|nr:hypothetical protein [Armatimonadota bacterium]